MIVKGYADGSCLEYNYGTFDKWCVYYTDKNGKSTAPKDIDCFKYLCKFADKYGKNRIYDDFVEIYQNTDKNINKNMLDCIENIARKYGEEDREEIDKTFTTIYMAMISEERKAKTKLGKRIKRLGIHVLLIEERAVEESATFMNGKNWREIDEICRKRGF